MADVAIVTGASRGIGAATARLLGARGYRVCVNYRTEPEPARELCAEIEAVGGRADEVAEMFATSGVPPAPVILVLSTGGATR